ncbi:MAG: acetyl-CoA carboxylase carboxyltransferase subunit alpha [Thermotogae bacterium]|nr:acetyl-CoA carboxylase carboxyltransferase subunit alpha [Thermotogota bacterium]
MFAVRYLDFERPLANLEEELNRLKEQYESQKEENLLKRIRELEKQIKKLRYEIFSKLTRWQKVQLARHPDRPKPLDLISYMCEDFVELHGDRLFGDDAAVVAGLGKIDRYGVVIIGIQKGKDTEENLKRNFGMAHPEGYRKAIRLFDLADKLKLPVLTLVDTPGAYPGIGAEERGQFSAIAHSIKRMLLLKVPSVAFITGEGGSGGALALAAADRVYMLEYSIYSVISPEGAASILFKDASRSKEAAETLKITADDLYSFGIIDGVIKEPLGGAHRDPKTTAVRIKRAFLKAVSELKHRSPRTLQMRRFKKYVSMGKWVER